MARAVHETIPDPSCARVQWTGGRRLRVGHGIRSLLRELLATGRREGSVRANIDVDAAAAVLFEIGWAVVRTALEGDGQIPLRRESAQRSNPLGWHMCCVFCRPGLL
jgi:hypothetical protein